MGGSSGAWVYDVDAHSDGNLFSGGAGRRRTPASNEKLFTTAATLERFGAGHEFETRLFGRGRRTGRDDHVLNGNLILVGDGDPSFGTDGVAQLAREVRNAGIGRVTAGVRVDDAIFDRRRGVAATGWGADQYLPPLSGLSFNSGYGRHGYARDPALAAGRELKRALRRRGVDIGGHIKRADVHGSLLETNPVADVSSPDVGHLIEATNKPSNNFYAEMLLKRLAARPSKQGTTKRGARKVEAFAHSVGIQVHAVDGSGLGDSNEVSPKQVGNLLVAMTKDGPRACVQALPPAGRPRGNRRRSHARHGGRGPLPHEDGHATAVSALSGYCEAGHGLVAFSILMNHVDVNAAREAQDEMAALIARYRP